MNSPLQKIAFGGGCHWCTEAIFQSLIGVQKVDQGFVASDGISSSFSEAVVLHFDKKAISLEDLIEVHIHTHKSTSNHSMRKKYRSAVYTFSENQHKEAIRALDKLKESSDRDIVTEVLPFKAFRPSEEQFNNYYYTNPKKPFCQNHIHPKLKLLLERFQEHTNRDMLHRSFNELKRP